MIFSTLVFATANKTAAYFSVAAPYLANTTITFMDMAAPHLNMAANATRAYMGMAVDAAAPYVSTSTMMWWFMLFLSFNLGTPVCFFAWL